MHAVRSPVLHNGFGGHPALPTADLCNSNALRKPGSGLLRMGDTEFDTVVEHPNFPYIGKLIANIMGLQIMK